MSALPEGFPNSFFQAKSPVVIRCGMDKEQQTRYSRQIQLPEIGFDGQERLLASRALIIGVGGLGSPAAMYLAAAGVGQLTLVDYDQVDLSNLQRQVAHTNEDIGRLKTDSARETCQALNPDVRIDAIARALDAEELDEVVATADVVLDASDNFPTRYALNDACVRRKKPLVSGAAMRMEGQVAVFRLERPESPCYRCLYRNEPEHGETCSQIGVLAPLVGIIGSIQAMEAIKVLINSGGDLTGRLLLLDGAKMEWHSVKVPKDLDCPVCSVS